MSDADDTPPFDIGPGTGATVVAFPSPGAGDGHTGRATITSLSDIPECRAYLARIGAEPRSMRTAVVRKQAGRYWRDVCKIVLDRDGTVKAPKAYAPTDAEAGAIKQAAGAVAWPETRPLPLDLAGVPRFVTDADPKDVFRFLDRHGEPIMLQVRVEPKPGERAYWPVTFWSDGEWRQLEPDGPLPLWGTDVLCDHETVFVHEGAKAARVMREMCEARTPEMQRKLDAHPWGRELGGAAHVGWIGGALSPHRTGWDVLRESGIKRVYVVSDNDRPGVAAVPAISKAVNLPCYHVQFTNEWPASFDLADEFPGEMFAELDGIRRYIGPRFRDVIHPATWATDMVTGPDGGKPVAVIRESFVDAWAYVEEADVFVCKEFPHIRRVEAVLNKMSASFSDVSETSRLIVRSFRGRTPRLCYRPDIGGRVVTNKGTSAINLHVPSGVRAREGNPAPWLGFLAYMFPDPVERKEVMRWCATLIARPGTRMHYGLLLASESQGIGKTTLASAVLAPLVGEHNVGWPTESDITASAFNSWLAHKRLVVVNEIYSGHSWKAYNNLKEVITDSEVSVNEKHMKGYVIENWAHVVACSNSLRALKVEGDDRRWFYPRVTERAWTRDQFAEFRKWLGSGGLEIVAHWAEGFGDYVMPGARAPMTARKAELIQESRSEGQQEAVAFAQALVADERPGALALKAVMHAVRAAVQGRMYDTEVELKKAMIEAGATAWGERVLVHGRMQTVLVNPAGKRMLADLGKGVTDPKEMAGVVRSMLREPAGLLEPEM